MNFLKYVFFILPLLISCAAYSQVTGEWFAVETELALTKKFSIENRLEARAMNTDGFHIAKYLTQLGLGYQFNQQFKSSVIYRFAWELEENLHYYYQNRLMVDTKFEQPAGQFKFVYRVRFQRDASTYVTSERDNTPILHLRNLFAITYVLPDKPIEPAVFLDAFTPLNGHSDNYLDRLYMGAELEFELNERHSFTGIVMYVNDRFRYQESAIILRLFYNISIG